MGAQGAARPAGGAEGRGSRAGPERGGERGPGPLRARARRAAWAGHGDPAPGTERAAAVTEEPLAASSPCRPTGRFKIQRTEYFGFVFNRM